MVESDSRALKKRSRHHHRNEEDDPSASTQQAATQEDPEEEQKDTTAKRHSDNQGMSMTRDDELIINTSEQIEIVTSFDQLGIPEQLLRGKLSHYLVS